MAEPIPKDVFDKLEREWRFIHPQREPQQKPQIAVPSKLVKIARVD